MNTQKYEKYLIHTILMLNSCYGLQKTDNSIVNSSISSAFLSGQRITLGFDEKDVSDLKRHSSECFRGPYSFSQSTDLDGEYAANYTFDGKQYFNICMISSPTYPSRFVGLETDYDGVKGPMWLSPDPANPDNIFAIMTTKVFSKNDLKDLQGIKFTINAKTSIRVKYPNKQQFDDAPGHYRHSRGIHVSAVLHCNSDPDKEGYTENAAGFKGIIISDERHFEQDIWKNIELIFSKSQVDLSKCREGLFLSHSVHAGAGYHFKSVEIQLLVEK